MQVDALVYAQLERTARTLGKTPEDLLAIAEAERPMTADDADRLARLYEELKAQEAKA